MNQLLKIDEFRKVLANYHLSDSAQETLRNTRLVLLVGVTSSGRNTIIDRLVAKGGYHYIVSDTTRQPRVKDGVPIEQNGREYWFRSEQEVLADLKEGEYLEAAIIHNQQVSGSSIREIEDAHKSERIAITEVEPNGAHTICGLKPDTIAIFVVLPNFEEWMARLRARSDLPEDEIRRRLQTAAQEIQTVLAHDYYHFVVNDKLETAIADVDAIARTSYVNPETQQNARSVAQKLYFQTEEYLKSI